MSNATKVASATMRSLRRCRPRNNTTPSPRTISSTSTNSSGARASAETVSWEMNGSTIIATNKCARPATSIKNPSLSELKNLFATSALPMIGFGFMDNFIMIQAGGYIDSTLGVKFGLTTLTAAAMGQVVSDVSGVLCGSTVDSAITRLGLVKHNNMSPAQRRLPLSRRVSLSGAVVGVILGCGLGATSLYFVSHHNHEEQHQLAKMKAMLLNMLRINDIGCEECTLYIGNSSQLLHGVEHEVLSSSDQMTIHLRRMSASDATAISGATITSKDEDDEKSHVIRAPIFDKKSLLAVLEFVVKRPYDSPETGLRERELQYAQMTARHVGVILDQGL